MDTHLWVRRTAILAQLKHREATDLELLADVIDANLEGSLHGSDFFIRKAIGWALRQHARTDPDWVRAFVDSPRPRDCSACPAAKPSSTSDPDNGTRRGAAEGRRHRVAA